MEGFDEETAAQTPEDQAEQAAAAIGAASGLGLYGYYTSGATEVGVASTTGHAVAQATTDVSVLTLAAGDDVSGYAEATSWRAAEIDPATVAQAADKAARTKDAGQIEPATFRAVLEPYAVSELSSISASPPSTRSPCSRAAATCPAASARSSSATASRSGTTGSIRGYPKAFDLGHAETARAHGRGGGRPRRGLGSPDREAGGAESTGHGLSAPAQSFGPVPFNLSLAGGDAASVDELADRVGDGIYITRLHYLGVVDPREGIITGMTRDGTFRIEGGKVTTPLVNLRFTTSFPALAAGLLGLTEEVSLVNRSDFYDERYPFQDPGPGSRDRSVYHRGHGLRPGPLMSVLVLVGTRKGLFLLESDEERQDWSLEGPVLTGWSVHAVVDPRDRTIHAATNNEVYGATTHRSADRGQTWTRAPRSWGSPRTPA